MPNQQARDYAVLILISVLLSYIKPVETTRKIDRLRKHIRKQMGHTANTKPELYLAAANLADTAWEESKKELGAGSKKYAVYVDTMCVTLYALIEDPKVQRAWFTERTFDAAMNSLEAASGKRTVGDAESYALRDLFAEKLGFPTSNSKLSLIKMKLGGAV